MDFAFIEPFEKLHVKALLDDFSLVAGPLAAAHG